MKLYNRKQFLALPAGVVFTKDDSDIDNFQIKGDTKGENDFTYKPLVSINSDLFETHHDAVVDLRAIGRANADLCNWYRDGLYDDDEMFVVLERHEVGGLVLSLEQALGDGYPRRGFCEAVLDNGDIIG